MIVMMGGGNYDHDNHDNLDNHDDITCRIGIGEGGFLFPSPLPRPLSIHAVPEKGNFSTNIFKIFNPRHPPPFPKTYFEASPSRKRYFLTQYPLPKYSFEPNILPQKIFLNPISSPKRYFQSNFNFYLELRHMGQ